MITLICGTNRPGSNTRKITAIIEGIYRNLRVETRVLDLRELPLELFSPEAYANKPAAFEPFAQAVLDSDGLVVVMPEYNGSMPGVLKVFIDHLKFPESFEGRPVCFVGLSAGIWGSIRGVEQLQAIFGYRNAFVFSKRVFMPGIGNLLGERGILTNTDMAGRLREQAEEYVSFVERLRKKRLRTP